MEPPAETTPRSVPPYSQESAKSFSAFLSAVPGAWTWNSLLPKFCAVISAVCVIAALTWSRHWPLFHDAAIMHYVVFLMDHGWRPYADIVDINMPGSYMVEWFAVHVFGSGSVAWRVFDCATMAVVFVSALMIVSGENRLAGALGGMAILLFHLSNGPTDVGERDWSLMVFVLAGFACYVRALRGGRPLLFFWFAMLSGCAAAIKPPAFPFPFALLLLGCWVLRKEHKRLGPWLLAALAGASVPALGVLAFLWHYHAFSAFLEIARGLIPFYAVSGNLPLPYLLHVAIGLYMLGIALLAAFVCWSRGTWRQWEVQATLLGIGFGAFLYFSQRKGWQQHKETLFAFLLLWITVQFVTGLRMPANSRGRVVSAAGLVLLTLLLVKWTLPVRTLPFSVPGSPAIEADLRPLGEEALTRNVQCVEMVTGCIKALYDLRLQPSTGFLFDSFLFTPAPNAAVQTLRTRFLNELTQQPPSILIIGASDWEAGNIMSYDRLARWPDFERFLNTRYTLRHEYNAGPVIDRGSYRLYERR